LKTEKAREFEQRVGFYQADHEDIAPVDKEEQDKMHEVIAK
jgi:hypothetical protein